ncbi:MAG: transposase [Planctomycetaceae bacterium]|nr:transposase [Planctomycetaceae bacterium]
MARFARLNIADMPQHIVQRGNNRQATFFTDDDYAVYLDKPGEYASKFKVSVHAFILMSNHVHLLATPSTKTGASDSMQSVGRYYVLYINKTYARSGTLWEGRFKSAPVDEDGYFVSRYIELNPVRAKMASHAGDYPWSSYQGNALGKKISLLTPHPCYLALGKDDKMRRKSYSALFRRTIGEAVEEDIRTSTQKGWAIGNDRFRTGIEQMTNRRASP